MEPITCWSRFNTKTGQYQHNHIEDGHSQDIAPKPISQCQKKAWKGAKWKSQKAYLHNHKVVEA